MIERVNEWIAAGRFRAIDLSKARIRRIAIGRAFHCSTEVDRSPSFLKELTDLGERRAAEFRTE